MIDLKWKSAVRSSLSLDLADPAFLVVDLFCGAGGTTTGFEEAYYVGADGQLHKTVRVIACVNHDHKAIKSHWKNHKHVRHFNEDIRTLDLSRLMHVVKWWRRKYPNAKLILWASLECTNFSKAKGGLPRDADSRTLADHLHRYVAALNPDIIQIENVVEFMSWGPLDKNGRPISRKSGSDWLRWRKEICAHGYVDEWRELNSADFGAYTSRNRLFGMFARERSMIHWPEPTHAKQTKKNICGRQLRLNMNLAPWKAVKDVLDFSDEGQSIFDRKKPLSDNTLERIYAGLLKYVAKGDTAFISKYFSGRPAGKVKSVDEPAGTVTTFGGQTLVNAKYFADLSIDEPAGSVTCKDHHAVVQAFITQRNSGDPSSKIVDIDGPARTLTGTGGNQDLVKPKFLIHYYGKSGTHSSVEEPGRTISTRDRSAVVNTHFLEKSYGGYRNNQSVDQPAGSVMPNDKHRLIEAEPYILNKNSSTAPSVSTDNPAPTITQRTHCVVNPVPFLMPTSYDNKPKSVEDPAPTIQASRRHHYLVNPSWGGLCASVENSCPVIIARQDKAPLYLVHCEHGPVQVAVYEEDSPIAIKIKEFMAYFGLVDIKMRMLRVLELLRIQGFPANYVLEGNQTDQKKFIGNSVVPVVVTRWIEAIDTGLRMAA